MKHSGLPRWMEAIQNTFLLSLLILAEAYLLGYLMTLGWVRDIEDPAAWGWFHGIGVALFFAAGASCAGIALKCSLKAAYCFQNKQVPMALFNLLGLFGFCGAELWASLSERSGNLAPSPADNAVLGFFNVLHASFSPSVVVVAILLPFASLYYGFSQMNQAEETAEELAMRMEREKIRAQVAGEIAAIKAANRRKIYKAYTEDEQQETPVIEAPSPVEMPAFAEVKAEESPLIPAVDGLPENRWTPKQYRAYVLAEYGYPMGDDEAISIVRSVGKEERSGTVGRPFIAPIGRLKQRAKRDHEKVRVEHKPAEVVAGIASEMAE